MAFVPDPSAVVSSSEAEQSADIIEKMEAAYTGIETYQTETEVDEYRDSKLTGTQRFLYTFKKPDHIRMDMETPRPGSILVYPDKKGKVLVKLPVWTGFLRFQLSLDSTFLGNNAGQRIDQTDMGLLIRNISRSLTDKRRGELKIWEQNSLWIIQVLADDHFLSGVKTLYRFSIDKTIWLPVGVEEFTPDGIIKRKVIFRNVKTSIVVPKDFFAIE
ncbi:MAG: hypothetical protein H6Q57_2013 [Geobacteraceae bacterium]|nr:hypothetical protein [Geobacteraceae bacterium]